LEQEACFKTVSSFPLFAVLDCPDLVPTKHVLSVAAHALNVRTKTFKDFTTSGELSPCVTVMGAKGLPALLLLKGKPGEGMTARFSTLLPEESGRALVNLLQGERRKQKQLMLTSSQAEATDKIIRRISWAWKGKRTEFGLAGWSISYHNEYRSDSKVTDLIYNSRLDRFDTFVVTINDPLHIRPALELFQEVLRRAPNQMRKVRSSLDCDWRTLLTPLLYGR